MLKPYLRKIDLIIYFICFCLAVGAILSINYFDVADDTGELNLKKLGFVVDQRNITKRKQVDSLAWRKVYNNHSLFSGDKVFTEERSLATLGVGKKTEIDLSELTLMRVDEEKNGSVEFDFIDGFFVARVDKGDRVEKVKVGDTLLLPTGGENSRFQVANDGLYKDIAVADGKLMLNQNGKQVEIKKNQFVKIKKGATDFTVNTASYRLSSPDLNQKIYLAKKSNINFRWINLENRIIKNSEFVIAKDEKFKKIIHSEQITSNYLDLDKKWISGEYFWKIRTSLNNKKKDLSFTQRFYVFVLNAPVITRPILGEKLHLNEGDQFNISWIKSDAESYEYKILLNNNGDMISMSNDKTSETFLSNNVNLFGQYLIQVRAIKEEVVSEWSKPHSFIIKKKQKAFDAVLTSPENNSSYVMTEKPILFSWHGSDDAEYLIEISKDKDFSELVVSKSLFDKKYEYIPQEEGKLFWRVSKDKNLKNQKYWVITANLEPPVLNSSLKKRLITEKNELHVNLAWKASGNSEYIIEVSENMQFTNILLTKKTNLKSINLALKSGKMYFFRVARTNSNVYSNIEEILIQKVEPLKAPKIKKNFKFKLKQTFIDKQIGPYIYGFSPLFASNKVSFNTYIDINWDSMDSAREYEIIIYADSEEKKRLVQEVTTKSYFRWKNPSVGTYYWKLRYSDKYKRQSEFSNISKIVIEKEMIKKIVKPKGIPYFSQVSPSHRFKTIEKSKVTLRWAKVRNTKSYKVLLYTDFDKGKLFKTIKTNSSSISLKFPDGQFYWKVEALNAKGKKIGKTRARQLLSIKKEVIPLIVLEDKKPKKVEKKKVKPKKIIKKNVAKKDKDKKIERNDFLDRKTNPNMHSFVLGGLKPGTYNLSTDLDGSLSTSSDNLIMLASFDIYAGLNYSEEYFFEGFYDYKTAGNSDLTIFDHTYGAIAYKYYLSEKTKNIMYGVGARHSIFTTEMQSSDADSSVNLNYFNIVGKILFDIPLFIFEQRISLEVGYGFLSPTSFYYQLSYHAKYYYFKSAGLTPLNNVFIFFGGEYFSRNIDYLDSEIEIQNLLGVAGVGLDVKF